MNRISIVQKITEEYNIYIEKYKAILEATIADAKKIYDNSVKKIDDQYRLTIKQIDAIFDSYEITMYQIKEYSNILKTTICDFPKWELFTLDTTINFKQHEINSRIIHVGFNTNDSVWDSNPAIHNLNFIHQLFCITKVDVYINKLETTIEYFMENNKIINTNPRLDKYNCDNYHHIKILYDVLTSNIHIYFNNSNITDYSKCLLIEEQDLLILSLDNIYLRNLCTFFFRISTGEILYKLNHDDTDEFNFNFKFMYSNNTIIAVFYCYHKYIKIYEYNIIHNKIHTRLALTFNSDFIDRCSAVTMKPDLLNIRSFYLDSRGLYYCDYKTIYYITSLHSICNTKDNTIISNTMIKKIVLDIKIKLAEIIRIDYSKYKIYFNRYESLKSYENKIADTIISLNALDVCTLLY